MAKDLAVVLNNGSINSAVATALAAQRYRPIMMFAETALAGSPRVRAAFDLQVTHFKPYREFVLPVSQTQMVAPAASPAAMAADPRRSSLLAGQLVELLPLVSAAARVAVHFQAAAVYLGLRVGARADDLAQATEYVQIWNELLQLPCGQPELEVVAPLLELEPWQVVDVGVQVNTPFERAWSCLGEGEEPCWSCRACRAREAAFEQAGKPDPAKKK